ncbi:MAG: sulfotransferase domain-containing protein [Candidatus Aminicenantes bacterium]|nr:sulfotransferase domain-containing protein [Candidatus Aminicenantes bacterium]
MKLDNTINYIASGIERSGTSLLMQILEAGGLPMAFDTASRPPDDNNPRGYYELESGKIISRLMNGTFPLADHRGRFIKITAFGLKFLPPGKYRIIYTERNIEEVLDSMEKMAKLQDQNREETKASFIKLNDMIKSLITGREDVDVLFVNYNRIVADPITEIRKICDFLGSGAENEAAMVAAVDAKLYRKRRPNA